MRYVIKLQATVIVDADDEIDALQRAYDDRDGLFSLSDDVDIVLLRQAVPEEWDG